MTRYDGAFLEAERAFKRLGLYGGDDGVTPNLPAASLEKAAAAVGQVVKADVVKKGQLGIKFLARVYSPNVWFGDLSSCVDLPRQLGKFHATTVLDPKLSPEAKLLSKAIGFALSDANTPVIGPLCTKVVQLSKLENAALAQNVAKFRRELDGLRSYNSCHESGVQYPNDNDGWMFAYFAESMPGFDMVKFSNWLYSCKNLHDMLSPPLCQEPEQASAKVAAVVDGIVVGPKAVKNTASKPTARSRQAARR